MTGNDGAVSSSYAYDAFGNLQGDPLNSDTKYLYTGQQFDNITDLYSLRARYYDPSLGRFTSRDTWAYNYQNPMELNRYVYAAGNPVRYTDPSGYTTLAKYGLVIGAIAISGSLVVACVTHVICPSSNPANNRALSDIGRNINQGFDKLIQSLMNACNIFFCPNAANIGTVNMPWSKGWNFSGTTPQAGINSQEYIQRRVQELTNEAENTRNNPDYDIAYRNPDPVRNEHPFALITGFLPKMPTAQFSPSEHIRRGSSIQTQWISLTRNLGLAEAFKTAGNPIYAINLKEVLGLVLDFTIPTVRMELDVEARRIARAAGEVLVLGWIPPTAIKALIP